MINNKAISDFHGFRVKRSLWVQSSIKVNIETDKLPRGYQSELWCKQKKASTLDYMRHYALKNFEEKFDKKIEKKEKERFEIKNNLEVRI